MISLPVCLVSQNEDSKKFQESEDILLSIVVPVYNAADYISKCLESLINQTYKNIEIICVNDGSKDNSLEILKNYEERDARIILIDKKNGGVSSARNTGIDVAKGDFITFVDSDDYIDTDAYSNCIRIIKEKDADILAFGYVQEPEHIVVKPYKNKIYETFDCLKNEFEANCTVWNKIFKRCLIFDENIRFAEDISFGEDDLFLEMVASNAEKIVGCSASYYHYEYIENSTTHVYDRDKVLISAINRCNYLVDYYTRKGYKTLYSWVLTHCLNISYQRIQGANDDMKKECAKKLLAILDDKLLKEVGDIPKAESDYLNKLRICAGD